MPSQPTPARRPPIRKLAIACQGGGSHCAFGAGVLQELLAHCDADGLLHHGGHAHQIVALSGTSGGAINALLGWQALLQNQPGSAAQQSLQNFWQDMSANTPEDSWNNFFTVQSMRLRELIPHVEVAPNFLSMQAQTRIRTLLLKHVAFQQLHSKLTPHTPRLLIGAANVRSGHAHVFRGGPTRVPKVDEILASTAVPSLFSAVEIDGVPYWDGLLSQNPPIRNFLAGCSAADKPDAIWLIRINPQSHVGVPKRLADITDRQNEMAGNLSLEQEHLFIQQINRWIAKGTLCDPDFKHIHWSEISLETKSHDGSALDYASKLDRDPKFIRDLIDQGREAARHFLQHHRP